MQLEKAYNLESGGLSYILGPVTEFVHGCNFSASQGVKCINSIY